MRKLLILFTLFISYASFGQEYASTSLSIQTDRITNNIYWANYSSAVLPKGALHLEADLVYISERVGRKPYVSKYRFASLPDFRLRYGLLKGLEVRAGTRIGFAYRDVSPLPIGDSDPILIDFKNPTAVLHSDYLTIGIKARILSYHNKQGALAVVAESYLPVLRPAEAFGPYHLPTITLINSDYFTSSLYYIINAGTLLSYDSPKGLISRYRLSLFPVYALHERAHLYLGVEGNYAPFYQTFTSTSLHTGVIFIAGPGLQLKATFSTERWQQVLLRNYMGQLGMVWCLKSN